MKHATFAESLSIQIGKAQRWALERAKAICPSIILYLSFCEPFRTSPRVSGSVDWCRLIFTGPMGGHWESAIVRAPVERSEGHLDSPVCSGRRAHSPFVPSSASSALSAQAGETRCAPSSCRSNASITIGDSLQPTESALDVLNGSYETMDADGAWSNVGENGSQPSLLFYVVHRWLVSEGDEVVRGQFIVELLRVSWHGTANAAAQHRQGNGVRDASKHLLEGFTGGIEQHPVHQKQDDVQVAQRDGKATAKIAMGRVQVSAPMTGKLKHILVDAQSSFIDHLLCSDFDGMDADVDTVIRVLQTRFDGSRWIEPGGAIAELEFCPHDVQYQGICTLCLKEIGRDQLNDSGWGHTVEGGVPEMPTDLDGAFARRISLDEGDGHAAPSEPDVIKGPRVTHVPLAYQNQQLMVNLRTAERLEEENARRLVSERKLSLVLDLDHTLLHATNDPRASAALLTLARVVRGAQNSMRAKGSDETVDVKNELQNMDALSRIIATELENRSQEHGNFMGALVNPVSNEALEATLHELGIFAFQLPSGISPVSSTSAVLACNGNAQLMTSADPPDPLTMTERRPQSFLSDGVCSTYYIKFRPGLRNFLQAASARFELHIYTMGSRSYADTVASIIDPDKRLFQGRITSRDDFEDGRLNQKNLKHVFPCDDSMVLVVDDREDVWVNHEAPFGARYFPNLIKARPYYFFRGLEEAYHRSPNPPASASTTLDEIYTRDSTDNAVSEELAIQLDQNAGIAEPQEERWHRKMLIQWLDADRRDRDHLRRLFELLCDCHQRFFIECDKEAAQYERSLRGRAATRFHENALNDQEHTVQESRETPVRDASDEGVTKRARNGRFEEDPRFEAPLSNTRYTPGPLRDSVRAHSSAPSSVAPVTSSMSSAAHLDQGGEQGMRASAELLLSSSSSSRDTAEGKASWDPHFSGNGRTSDLHRQLVRSENRSQWDSVQASNSPDSVSGSELQAHKRLRPSNQEQTLSAYSEQPVSLAWNSRARQGDDSVAATVTNNDRGGELHHLVEHKRRGTRGADRALIDQKNTSVKADAGRDPDERVMKQVPASTSQDVLSAGGAACSSSILGTDGGRESAGGYPLSSATAEGRSVRAVVYGGAEEEEGPEVSYEEELDDNESADAPSPSPAPSDHALAWPRDDGEDDRDMDAHEPAVTRDADWMSMSAKDSELEHEQLLQTSLLATVGSASSSDPHQGHHCLVGETGSAKSLRRSSRLANKAKRTTRRSFESTSSQSSTLATMGSAMVYNKPFRDRTFIEIGGGRKGQRPENDVVLDIHEDDPSSRRIRRLVDSQLLGRSRSRGAGGRSSSPATQLLQQLAERMRGDDGARKSNSLAPATSSKDTNDQHHEEATLRRRPRRVARRPLEWRANAQRTRMRDDQYEKSTHSTSRWRPPANVKVIMATIRGSVLAGCHLCFSGVIPRAHATSPDDHELWRMAVRFGATCYRELVPEVTHLVVDAQRGRDTFKAHQARKMSGVFIVQTEWLLYSLEEMRRVSEIDFLLLDEPNAPGTENMMTPYAGRLDGDRKRAILGNLRAVMPILQDSQPDDDDDREESVLRHYRAWMEEQRAVRLCRSPQAVAPRFPTPTPIAEAHDAPSSLLDNELRQALGDDYD